MAGLHLGPGEHLQHIKAVCLKCRQWCFMGMTFKVLHLLVLCIKTIFFFIKKSTLPETFFIFLGSPTCFPYPLPHAWARFPKYTIKHIEGEQGPALQVRIVQDERRRGSEHSCSPMWQNKGGLWREERGPNRKKGTGRKKWWRKKKGCQREWNISTI